MKKTSKDKESHFLICCGGNIIDTPNRSCCGENVLDVKQNSGSFCLMKISLNPSEYQNGKFGLNPHLF